MTLADTLIALLLIAAWILWGVADRHDVFAIAVHKLRIRCGRQAPVGWHRIESGFRVRVGRPDTILVFKLPLHTSESLEPIMHVAVTDASTRFMVGDAQVTLDGFLEAYDDELGPLVAQIDVPGKLTSIGIDASSEAPA